MAGTSVKSTSTPVKPSSTPVKTFNSPVKTFSTPLSSTPVSGSRLVPPGLAPCPAPLLHQTCHGYRVGEMAEILILYSGECEASCQWRDYLSLMFGGTEAGGGSPGRTLSRVTSRKIEDFAHSQPSKSTVARDESVYHASLQLVIVSPSLLQWLAGHQTPPAGRLLHPSSVIGLLLGVTAGDMTPGQITPLMHFPQWRLVEIANDKQDTEYLTNLTDACREILENKQKENIPPPEPMFKLFPRKVSPSQPKLLVILDDPLMTSRPLVEVIFALDDRRFTVEDHKWVSDTNLQIESPPEMFTTSAMASVSVKLHGRHGGSRQLKVETSLKIIETAWQGATEPLVLFSQVIYDC